MRFDPSEAFETVRMFGEQHLDIRAVTLGVNTLPSAAGSASRFRAGLLRRLREAASRFSVVVREVADELGVPVVNRRVATSPAAVAFPAGSRKDYEDIARTMDEAAAELDVDFIGGLSALVHKGASGGDEALIAAIPRGLAQTERVCASVNVASTRSGINMDAVAVMGRIVKEAAEQSAGRSGVAAAKLGVFANVPEDNPFMPGAMHGLGEPSLVVNVAVSGPGVVAAALKAAEGADLRQVAETVKKAAFKITRTGELVGRRVAERLGVEFGVVDISLAPTPEEGDSVADVIETMGVEQLGAPGSTAALFLLTEAMKKGGAFAASFVGGLSGAFVPVMEDAGAARAVTSGALSIEKLEALTAVCSVGLDMIPIPGDTPAETVAAVIADEMAIGVANDKTAGVRLIPVPGGKPGDEVDFGGLLGRAAIMSVSEFSSHEFVRRGGRIPPPVRALRN